MITEFEVQARIESVWNQLQKALTINEQLSEENERMKIQISQLNEKLYKTTRHQHGLWNEK